MKKQFLTQSQFMSNHTITLSAITSGPNSIYELRVYKGGHGKAIYEKLGHDAKKLINNMLFYLNVVNYGIEEVTVKGIRTNREEILKELN